MMTKKSKELTRSQSTPARSLATTEALTTAPRADIYESDDAYLVVADLPGVPAGGADITIEEGTVRIVGTQAAHIDLEGYAPVRFQRTFAVPDIVDPAGVTANLADGVLELTLPKSERARPRKITVQAG